MPPGHSLHQVTTQAVTPDQLLPYVGAVSPMRSSLIQSGKGDCVLHRFEGRAVLVGYALHAPQDSDALDASVEKVLQDKDITHLTVLAATRPQAAPEHAVSEEDSYWAVPLPPAPPAQKLRHMLHRAAHEITLCEDAGEDCWSGEHAALVLHYINTRPLEPGTRHIFLHLGAYLANAPDAVLWSARDHSGHLQGCAIGDYSSMSTAFYMFAFRAPTAPPGVADSLLAAVLNEGANRGHTQCNLGLGINASIAFFKKKWCAFPFLPYVQTSWDIRAPKKSWLSRLLPI